MEMQYQPGMQYAMPPAKKNTRVTLLIIALIVIFCIASISVATNIVLFEKLNSLKNDVSAEIKDLQAKDSGMSTDMSALQGKVDSLTNVDISAIKTDITQLKDLTAVPDVKIKISSLSLTLDDSYQYTDYYDGEATITCSDTSSDYIALVKQTLNSGGTPGKSKVAYYLIDIESGTGTYYTSDYNTKGKLVRPYYTLEVLSFIKLNAIK
jgi:hypothetical protein